MSEYPKVYTERDGTEIMYAKECIKVIDRLRADLEAAKTALENQIAHTQTIADEQYRLRARIAELTTAANIRTDELHRIAISLGIKGEPTQDSMSDALAHIAKLEAQIAAPAAAVPARTNRELHEDAADMNLSDLFFEHAGIDPDAYPAAAVPDGEPEWPEYHEQGMGCGIEDRGITDRYDACRYGFEEARERCAQAFDNWLQSRRPAPAQDVVRDAERYRFLRKQFWADSPACVVMNPKVALKLGADCPFEHLLDKEIDALLAASKGGA